MTDTLLDVRGLTVRVGGGSGAVTLVDELSFSVGRGEVVCIVGESGCGKTVTARSVIGLNRIDPAFRLSGAVVFDGENLLELGEEGMRKLRGARIAMIFQDPMSSLNPLHRIGAQIDEALAIHTRLGRGERRRRTLELLTEVGIPNPVERIDDYPHQFSGGMRQRAMIALALAGNPDLLIADEPTTALDVTMQKQILLLLERLRAEHGMAIIFITHDMGVVAEIADRVVVMYAGRCVESGPVRAVLRAPQHPYTARLLASIPAASRARTRRLPTIKGMPPLPSAGRPAGCSFRPRCDFAFAQCMEEPSLEPSDDPAHLARCWLPANGRQQLFAAAVMEAT
jgi:oligopeptide/dipeptide ABC transporter ATP-binding protein